MKSKIREFQRITCMSKRFILLFVLASVLFSCSSDDNTDNAPRVLQKVVFYKDSPNERQWIINNGLLIKITKSDGTLVEEFTYDDQNRLVNDIEYSNGIDGESTSISYNADNTIKSIDGLPYTFNVATKTYAYSYGSNFTIICKVNDDGFPVDFVRGGVGASEYHMTYDNGDMTSYRKVNTGGADTVKNFYFEMMLGDNPIYGAVAAIAKVKALTDPSFFIDGQASKKLANGFDKGPSDTNYYNYGVIPDANLSQIGIEVLDSNNNFVEFYSFADYHYQ